MELSDCHFVLFYATDPSEVIAWLIATTDSFQCGPTAFLVRGCERERLCLAIEHRLPNRDGYFICTVDYPGFRRDPTDLPPFIKWLFKDPITTPASEGQYSFCTHCGNRVEPYSAYEEDPRVTLLTHDKPLRLTTDFLGGKGCYWCRSCESLWRAVSWRETTQQQECGHFVPLYLAYCATCGIKTKDDSPS